MASADNSAQVTQFHEKKGFYYINVKPGTELGNTFRAIVYEGFHSRTKNKIAAKRIQVGAEEQYVKMAENEADILMNTPPHENVIKVYNVIKEYLADKEEMVIYIMMEHGELGDLVKYTRKRQLGITSKLDIMLQCARGLQHLHNASPQVIHRDVKPQNIFLCGDPASPTAKLGDFGEARFLHRDDAHTPSLHSQNLYGTESYMAPEMFMRPISEVRYTKMVDIFALGLSFHALLNAKRGETMKPMKGESKFNQDNLFVSSYKWIYIIGPQTFLYDF